MKITIDAEINVEILLDGQLVEFSAKRARQRNDGSVVIEIHQSEGLLSSDFCEATRKLRRWARKGERLGEVDGEPCIVDEKGDRVRR